MSRRVILSPIVHTSSDLGTLSESVKARYVQESGLASWQERERVVEHLWSDIEDRIDRLDVDFRRLRLYQDGLPVCGFELQMVNELAGSGSRNHQLLLKLVKRGASLMGTEDPALLIREYQSHRAQLAPSEGPGRSTSPSSGEMAELLEARDRFIARQIDQTLQEGETGLVFLGAAHRLEMPPDSGIVVELCQGHFSFSNGPS